MKKYIQNIKKLVFQTKEIENKESINYDIRVLVGIRQLMH